MNRLMLRVLVPVVLLALSVIGCASRGKLTETINTIVDDRLQFEKAAYRVADERLRWAEGRLRYNGGTDGLEQSCRDLDVQYHRTGFGNFYWKCEVDVKLPTYPSVRIIVWNAETFLLKKRLGDNSGIVKFMPWAKVVDLTVALRSEA